MHRSAAMTCHHRRITGYPAPSRRAILATIKHTMIPVIVGKRKDTAVHFMLWVSFFIVQHVVPQGKCISENNMVRCV